MSTRSLFLLASIGSLSLLIGAFLFQYLGNMPPCKLCYWQRYPHTAAIILAIAAMITDFYGFTALGFLSTMLTSGIGAFHTGVERGWWDGPQTCTSPSIENLSIEELMTQIMSTPVVKCNDVSWQALGLSMASWNMILSFGLALIWFIALKRQVTG